MPEFIKHVASNMMNNPVKIEIKKKTLTVDRIKQNLYYLKRESKTDLLIRILDLYAFTKVMVFVNTKSKVEEIVSTLKKKGYKAEALHGDLKQVSRDKVMNGFKEGISHILVCTDVAARGIDVSDLEGIINFDLPQEQELYVHRIGRTGRAGREGLSITFATYSEQRKVFFIERYTRSQMTICQIPSVEEIQAKKIENFVNFLKNNSDVEINESNRPLIEQIKNLNLDTDKLISLLLSLTNFKLSDYPEIHVREEKPRQRSSRDRNERGLDRRNSRESRFEKSRRNDTRGKKDEKALRAEKYSEPKDYVLVKLNIGKENKVKPQELVLMASKLVGVRKSNIGNIKIKENETFVEVTKGALPFMLKLQGKNYNGKTIKVSKGNE
jgi:ATP-dependent RNA helicase DeaD